MGIDFVKEHTFALCTNFRYDNLLLGEFFSLSPVFNFLRLAIPKFLCLLKIGGRAVEVFARDKLEVSGDWDEVELIPEFA